VHKPAYAAFKAFATGPRASSACATDVDVDGPSVKLLSPGPDVPYLDKVLVKATASDGQGVSGMELFVDGKKIGGRQYGGTFSLEWNGARELAVGPHALVVKAYDTAQNVGEATATIVKADPNTMRVRPATLKFAIKRGKGRKLTVSGRVSAPGAPVQPRGKVRMFFEYRKTVKKGARRVMVWRPASRFTKDAKRPFRFSVKLSRAGTWRAYARYTGRAPFKPVRTGYTVLKRVR
jgi:hypothetical protein